MSIQVATTFAYDADPGLRSLASGTGRISSQAGFESLRRTLAGWAEHEPRAALAFALEHVRPPHRDDAVRAVLETWARRDPAAARERVEAETPLNLGWLDTVLATAGREQPQLAWSLAIATAQAHPEQAQGIFVSGLRGLLHTGAFALASQLVSTAPLDVPAGRFDLHGLVAGEWGRYAPDEAAAWSIGLPEGLERDQALISLAQAWSETDPQAAATFAAELPPGDARRKMLTQAVADWAEREPETVGRWLSAQKIHPNFDQVAAAVATAPRILTDQLPLAIGWADTIQDDDLRLQSLTSVMRHWLDRDASAARAYLQSNPDLPPATRAEIRRRLDEVP